MKKAFTALLLLLIGSVLNAEPIKFKGILGINFETTAVSDNWSGGEEDVLNWSVLLDAGFEKIYKKSELNTNAKIEYGKTNIEDVEKETADQIYLDSIYSLLIKEYLAPYINFNITTQNTEFFDPVTYTESIGGGVKVLKKEPHTLSTKLGVAFRQKFDPADDGESSLDDPETAEIEEVLYEIGAQSITNYSFILTENSKLSSELRLFSSFEGGVNTRWENSIYIKTGKFLTTKLGYLLIYDYDEVSRPVWPEDIQTRLNVAIGISYNLF